MIGLPAMTVLQRILVLGLVFGETLLAYTSGLLGWAYQRCRNLLR